MPVPFKIQKAALPLPIKKLDYGEVFTWNNTLLIWGGRNGQDYIWYTCSQFYSGEWIRKLTTGDAPYPGVGSSQIVGDKLFVLELNIIYALDLKTWIWTTFTPSGTRPSYQTSGAPSWVHNDKIYYLDFPYGPHLLCYNVPNNSWEWINQGGELPAFEVGRKALIDGDTVFLLALGYKTNGLHTLDMMSMKWKKVSPRMHVNLSLSMKVVSSSSYIFCRSGLPSIHAQVSSKLRPVTSNRSMLFAR